MKKQLDSLSQRSGQSPLVEKGNHHGTRAEAVETAGPRVSEPADHDVREDARLPADALPKLVHHVPVAQRRRNVAAVVRVERRPLLDVRGDVGHALAVVAAARVADLPVGVAVDLEEGHVRAAGRAGDVDGGRDAVGVGAAGVEGAGVGSKGGHLGRHDRVAGESSGEAAAVGHARNEDAAGVDAVGRRQVGEKLLRKGDIIDTDSGVWGALPVAVDALGVDDDHVGVDGRGGEAGDGFLVG